MLPDLPGVLREAAGRARSAGASPSLPLLGALHGPDRPGHRLPSAARTPCPAPSRSWTCRPRWSPSPSACGKVGRVTVPRVQGRRPPGGAARPRLRGRRHRARDEVLLAAYDAVQALIGTGKVLAAWTPGYGGAAEALFKMCVGNRHGLRRCDDVDADCALRARATAASSWSWPTRPSCRRRRTASRGLLGTTTEDYQLVAAGETIASGRAAGGLGEAPSSRSIPYRRQGEDVRQVAAIDLPAAAPSSGCQPSIAQPARGDPRLPGHQLRVRHRPRLRARRRRGRDRWSSTTSPPDGRRREHAGAWCRRIGDAARSSCCPAASPAATSPTARPSSSPPSSATPEVTEAVHDLLQARDGLMLGICNGFQALIKLGLVPYGDIRPMDDELPHADLQHHRPPPEPPACARAWPPT